MQSGASSSSHQTTRYARAQTPPAERPCGSLATGGAATQAAPEVDLLVEPAVAAPGTPRASPGAFAVVPASPAPAPQHPGLTGTPPQHRRGVGGDEHPKEVAKILRRALEASDSQVPSMRICAGGAENGELPKPEIDFDVVADSLCQWERWQAQHQGVELPEPGKFGHTASDAALRALLRPTPEGDATALTAFLQGRNTESVLALAAVRCGQQLKYVVALSGNTLAAKQYPDASLARTNLEALVERANRAEALGVSGAYALATRPSREQILCQRLLQYWRPDASWQAVAEQLLGNNTEADDGRKQPGDLGVRATCAEPAVLVAVAKILHEAGAKGCALNLSDVLDLTIVRIGTATQSKKAPVGGELVLEQGVALARLDPCHQHCQKFWTGMMRLMVAMAHQSVEPSPIKTPALRSAKHREYERETAMKALRQQRASLQNALDKARKKAQPGCDTKLLEGNILKVDKLLEDWLQLPVGGSVTDAPGTDDPTRSLAFSEEPDETRKKGSAHPLA